MTQTSSFCRYEAAVVSTWTLAPSRLSIPVSRTGRAVCSSARMAAMRARIADIAPELNSS